MLKRSQRRVLSISASKNHMDRTNDKLIIISNRGPNDFVWKDDHWEVRPAAGGLVSMIDPLARQARRDLVLLRFGSALQPANLARGFVYHCRRSNGSRAPHCAGALTVFF